MKWSLSTLPRVNFPTAFCSWCWWGGCGESCVFSFSPRAFSIPVQTATGARSSWSTSQYFLTRRQPRVQAHSSTSTAKESLAEFLSTSTRVIITKIHLLHTSIMSLLHVITKPEFPVFVVAAINLTCRYT